MGLFDAKPTPTKTANKTIYNKNWKWMKHWGSLQKRSCPNAGQAYYKKQQK